MRTTVNIEDDVASVARRYAAERGVTLGMALSMLVREAHAASIRDLQYPEGFEPFPYRPDEPLITTDHVKRLQDELP